MAKKSDSGAVREELKKTVTGANDPQCKYLSVFFTFSFHFLNSVISDILNRESG